LTEATSNAGCVSAGWPFADPNAIQPARIVPIIARIMSLSDAPFRIVYSCRTAQHGDDGLGVNVFQPRQPSLSPFRAK
jgi:hypothetical protein